MDPARAREDHPRPQLIRDRWVDLCGPWRFAHDDADVGLEEGWPERPEALDRTIEVPFPPESPASGVGDTGYHPVVWYARTFAAPQAAGERLLLHLGAVDYRASVWVNGRLVVTHEGGHTPFSADVTAALRPDGEQLVVVRAEDRPTDMAQPRGKQDWRPRPHSIWYERTTGIWQPVWLEPVPATRIESLRWTPDLARADVALRIGLRDSASATGQPGDVPLTARVRLTLRGEVVATAAFEVGAPRASIRLPVDAARIEHDRRALLWAPAHPNLLDATVTLPPAEGGGAHGHGAPDARRGRRRRGPQLRRPAPGDDIQRPAAAERPGDGAPDGPGSELLAAVAPRRAVRRGAAPRGGAGQGARLQRGPDPPEGRGPALPVLVRPAGGAGLGRDAQRPGLRHRHRRPADPRVARGARARRELAVHRGLGSVQRELGCAEPDGRRRAAARGARAVRADEGDRPRPAGRRQRRLGARGQRHPRRPRLQPGGRRPARAVRQPGRRHPDAAGDRAVLPLTGPARARAGHGTVDDHGVRGSDLRPGVGRLLERVRRRGRRGSARRALRRPGRRLARKPRGGGVLLHPAHRHGAGAQRAAVRGPTPEGRPGPVRRGEPTGLGRRAGRRDRRGADLARRAPAGAAGRGLTRVSA